MLLYRVNMTDLSVSKEENCEYQGLGGRSLSLRIATTEINSKYLSLNIDNKLILAHGLLAGNGKFYAGRLSLCTQNPLLHSVVESNVGGPMGTKLANLGIDAIVIEGIPQRDKTYIINVSMLGVFIEEMPLLKKVNIYDTAKILQKNFGKQVAIGCIGSAGEYNQMIACAGFTNIEGIPTHYGGRNGWAAVMGSKGVKGIIVDDSGVESLSLVKQTALVPEFETVENLCGACSKSCSAKKSKGRNKLLNGREELGIRTAADAVLFQELCNEDGIDAKELVNVLRVAIEAGVAQAGNGQEIFGLIHEISTGTLLGTILGSGSKNAAKILGTSVAKRLVRHSARKKMVLRMRPLHYL